MFKAERLFLASVLIFDLSVVESGVWHGLQKGEEKGIEKGVQSL